MLTEMGIAVEIQADFHREGRSNSLVQKKNEDLGLKSGG